MKFPKDSFPHNSVIEWWYYNGNLYSGSRRFSFMTCLFKADPKKTNIPLVKNIPSKNVYFSHSVFTDFKSSNVVTRTSPMSVLSKDSFTKERLFINYLQPSPTGYVNTSIEEIDDHTFRIKNEDVDLLLVGKKKRFMHNGHGGFIVRGKKVSYYSHTDFKAKGTVFYNGKYYPVNGTVWMDHEWAAFAGEKNWNWFSIQLDSGIEMMVQEYNNRENVYVGVHYPTGSKFASDLTLTSLSKWKSPDTGASYDTSWRISVPSLKIDLVVKAPIEKQEVLFGSLNYWEGAINVSGKVSGKTVKGTGFMELTGRKMQANLFSLYKKQLGKQSDYYFTIAKRDAANIWKNIWRR